MKFEKFTPLVKVDEKSHTVHGLVTKEVPDKDNEICDYDGASKAFDAWSRKFSDSTGASGQEKSLGNIRVQHSLQVGGKATHIQKDDKDKSIYLTSVPIDDEMWNKIRKGFYTGYSQAGSYEWRKCNECKADMPEGNYCKSCKKNVTSRYAPSIAEVSYVDNPCLDDARFILVKADGSEEVIKAMEKAGKETPKAPYGEETEYADPGYQSDKKKRYPIDTEEHIRAAWNYIHKPKNASKYSAEELSHIKGKIEAAWKEKIDPEGPPSAEKMVSIERAKAIEIAIQKTLEAKGKKLGKGMYALANLAALVEALHCAQIDSEIEQEIEQDTDSVVPQQLGELVEMAAGILVAMAEEETGELKSGSTKIKGKTIMGNELSKAHSLSAHLNTMKECVKAHHEKMQHLHKSHHDEMHEHLGKLHKILGSEEAGKFGEDEPKNMSVRSEGTVNTAETFKASDVAELVKSAVNEQFSEILKAIKASREEEDEDEKEKARKAEEEEKRRKAEEEKTRKGVGDRNDIAKSFATALQFQPKHVVAKKADDYRGTPQAGMDETVDVVKALSGDISEQLKLMKKSIVTQEVPVTLAGPMSKMA